MAITPDNKPQGPVPTKSPAAADPNEIETHEGNLDEEAIADEISDLIVGELQMALDQKDKKGILESLRALVLSCVE